MTSIDERELNQSTFRHLKDTLTQTYSPGRFVAISGGQIIGVAERFDELLTLIQGKEKDPTKTLIVQAGVDYPDSVTIFLQAFQHSDRVAASKGAVNL